MNMAPFAKGPKDPFKTADHFNPTANKDIFAKPSAGIGGGGGGGGGGAGGMDRTRKPEPVLEPLDIPNEPVEPAASESEKPKPSVILRNPKWDVEKVGFNEETDISVEINLPEERAHKTRVVFELYAKTPGTKFFIATRAQLEDILVSKGKLSANKRAINRIWSDYLAERKEWRQKFTGIFKEDQRSPKFSAFEKSIDTSMHGPIGTYAITSLSWSASHWYDFTSADKDTVLGLSISIIGVAYATNFNGMALNGKIWMNTFAGQVNHVGMATVIAHELGHNMGQAYANKKTDPTFGRPEDRFIPGIAFPKAVPEGDVYGEHGHRGSF